MKREGRREGKEEEREGLKKEVHVHVHAHVGNAIADTANNLFHNTCTAKKKTQQWSKELISLVPFPQAHLHRRSRLLEGCLVPSIF